MYERILVPLDGSEAAEVVLPYAEEIATKLSSQIILVSVSESLAADTSHLYDSYLLCTMNYSAESVIFLLMEGTLLHCHHFVK